jgi:hypothetical protein
MKLNYFKIAFVLMFFSALSYAQPKLRPILSVKGIGGFHQLKDLESMNKGQLYDLYFERIGILSSILPYYAMTSKPGVSIKDVGIPVNEANIKAQEKDFELRSAYIQTQRQYLSDMIPYCEKSNIIAAILFYEDTLKKIHLGDSE